MQSVFKNGQKILLRFYRLNYRHVLPDIILIVVSLYASLYLRLGFYEFGRFAPVLNRLLVLFVAIRLATLTVFGAYDIIWRFISFGDAQRLFKAIAMSSSLIIAATFMMDVDRLPRAVFIIDMFLVSFLMGASRFLRRRVYESPSGRQLKQHGRFTLLYGAGLNGRTLTQRFLTDSDLGFNVIGFVDDDMQKVGRLVSGVKVIGTRADLRQLLETLPVQELIVAIGRPSGELLREVVALCRNHGVNLRLINDLGGTADRKGIHFFREIGLADLLSRPQKEIQLEGARNLVRNRRVLITGAGGSIGSELARQIAGFNPSLLLLLDHSEFNLYQIDHELRESLVSTNLLTVPLLVDIKDRATLERVFEEHSPEFVFHAAAYKHVHLVEQNPCSSILNNVQGTKNLIEIGEGFGVEGFVLISTDKAVNPAGIMGMTKRLCELMVAQTGARSGKKYCSVRFGNVLGSSGSLIPLLKAQIEKGEPMTITHQDMTRYFMLISEAVSLVLKAASITQPGDITILRMGAPIRIVDIAKSLIALMGRGENDVPIIFTGLRPGEKMFEELYLCGNEINTEDPDILVLPKGDGVTTECMPENLGVELDQILALAQEGNNQAVSLLRTLINSNYRVPVQEKRPKTPPASPEPRVWQ